MSGSILDMIGKAAPRAGGSGLSYLALRDHIAGLIERGSIPIGTKLPSERRLGEVLPVARGTLRQALAQLETEGLIYRLDRRGWFVSPPRVRYDPTSSLGFNDYVTAQGLDAKTTTLAKSEVIATAEVAEILGIGTGDPVYCVRRCRLVGERPVLHETIFVNPKLAPGLLDKDLDTSLATILAKTYGQPVKSAELEMYPSVLSGDVAGHLQVAPGTPGLFLRRISHGAAGQIVEYDEEYWHHGAMSLSVTAKGKR